MILFGIRADRGGAENFRGHHKQLLTDRGKLDRLPSWHDWVGLWHLVCLTTSPSGETVGSELSFATRITSTFRVPQLGMKD